MKPLYAARVEDLMDGRTVGVRCLACDHLNEVPVGVIKARVSPNEWVKDLPRHGRCGVRGKTEMVIGHALGYEECPTLTVP